LAQFLYKHKKLALPGIGIFTLDPSVEIPDASNKSTHSTPRGIEFKNAVVHHADEELIAFIQSHTGKIKPVAVADLDSYLSQGAEMLNIGKPLVLEGIGIITRQKGGPGFDFSQVEFAAPEVTHAEKTEKTGKRKSVLEEANQFEPTGGGNRKFVMFLALVLGIGLIAWGGYVLYKKNGGEKKTDFAVSPADTVATTPDTTKLAVIDSATITRTAAAANISSKDSIAYKYVILQTYNKEHALRRYNQLRSYELKINLFTQDSTFFKLYFSFPAASRDTVHIKDSLSREYAHSVIIER